MNYLLLALTPLLFLLYVAFKLIIIPFWRLRFYKSQGLPCYFYPLLGFTHTGRHYEIQHNDLLGYYKQLPKEKAVSAEASHFGNMVTVVLLDPKVIGEFYNNQSKYRKINLAKGFNMLIGTGLILAEGSLWKNHRKTISNIFHFEFLKQNVPLVVSTTREFFDSLSRTSMKNISIMDEIQKITGEIVGRIFFGDNLNQHTIKGQPLTIFLADLLVQSFKIFRNPIAVAFIFLVLDMELIPSYRKYIKDIRQIREVCLQIVKSRKASQVQKNDLLGLLLETQRLKDSENRFSDNDIVNEFTTFFIAGMDTTGHLITMALYLLYKNPVYIDRLNKEINEFYNKNNIVDLESLNSMDLMHGILKEALRMYTPAPGTFTRVALEDHELMGIKIRKGDTVRPMTFYNYFNERYFENPDIFYPERWNKKMQDRELFVDIPFSAGARNCIGQHLAMIEAKIILAEFIKRFRFNIVPEDYKLVMTFNFLYEPKEKILMDLVCRQ